MQTWTQKYTPRKTSDIHGQDTPLSKIKDYVASYSTQKKKAALIYGPPGCGKTASVHALAEELGFDLIEVNASDFRDKESIEERLGHALKQYSLFSRGKIILIDEVDGVSGREDRGGLSAILKLIEGSRFPILMTANDPWEQNLSSLRSKTEMIEFNTLAYTTVRSVLKRICDTESVKYDDISVTSLARQAGGDLRGAIIDLQVLTEATKSLVKESVEGLSDRRQTDSMINALMKVFKSSSPEVALSAFQNVEEEVDEIFMWIDENLPKEYLGMEDLARAYNNISIADVFRGRIRRWQHWRFLVYITDLLSAGVALSKKEKYPGFSKYSKTTRILRIWQMNMKNAKRKAIAAKLAAMMHTSEKEAYKSVPFLKIMFASPVFKEGISAGLELEKEEIEYLSKH